MQLSLNPGASNQLHKLEDIYDEVTNSKDQVGSFSSGTNGRQERQTQANVSRDVLKLATNTTDNRDGFQNMQADSSTNTVYSCGHFSSSDKGLKDYPLQRSISPNSILEQNEQNKPLQCISSPLSSILPPSQCVEQNLVKINAEINNNDNTNDLSNLNEPTIPLEVEVGPSFVLSCSSNKYCLNRKEDLSEQYKKYKGGKTDWSYCLSVQSTSQQQNLNEGVQLVSYLQDVNCIISSESVEQGMPTSNVCIEDSCLVDVQQENKDIIQIQTDNNDCVSDNVSNSQNQKCGSYADSVNGQFRCALKDEVPLASQDDSFLCADNEEVHVEHIEHLEMGIVTNTSRQQEEEIISTLTYNIARYIEEVMCQDVSYPVGAIPFSTLFCNEVSRQEDKDCVQPPSEGEMDMVDVLSFAKYQSEYQSVDQDEVSEGWLSARSTQQHKNDIYVDDDNCFPQNGFPLSILFDQQETNTSCVDVDDDRYFRPDSPPLSSFFGRFEKQAQQSKKLRQNDEFFTASSVPLSTFFEEYEKVAENQGLKNEGASRVDTNDDFYFRPGSPPLSTFFNRYEKQLERQEKITRRNDDYFLSDWLPLSAFFDKYEKQVAKASLSKNDEFFADNSIPLSAFFSQHEGNIPQVDVRDDLCFTPGSLTLSSFFSKYEKQAQKQERNERLNDNYFPANSLPLSALFGKFEKEIEKQNTKATDDLFNSDSFPLSDFFAQDEARIPIVDIKDDLYFRPGSPPLSAFFAKYEKQVQRLEKASKLKEDYFLADLAPLSDLFDVYGKEKQDVDREKDCFLEDQIPLSVFFEQHEQDVRKVNINDDFYFRPSSPPLSTFFKQFEIQVARREKKLTLDYDYFLADSTPLSALFGKYEKQAKLQAREQNVDDIFTTEFPLLLDMFEHHEMDIQLVNIKDDFYFRPGSPTLSSFFNKYEKQAQKQENKNKFNDAYFPRDSPPLSSLFGKYEKEVDKQDKLKEDNYFFSQNSITLSVFFESHEFDIPIVNINEDLYFRPDSPSLSPFFGKYEKQALRLEKKKSKQNDACFVENWIPLSALFGKYEKECEKQIRIDQEYFPKDLVPLSALFGRYEKQIQKQEASNEDGIDFVPLSALFGKYEKQIGNQYDMNNIDQLFIHDFNLSYLFLDEEELTTIINKQDELSRPFGCQEWQLENEPEEGVYYPTDFISFKTYLVEMEDNQKLDNKLYSQKLLSNISYEEQSADEDDIYTSLSILFEEEQEQYTEINRYINNASETAFKVAQKMFDKEDCFAPQSALFRESRREPESNFYDDDTWINNEEALLSFYEGAVDLNSSDRLEDMDTNSVVGLALFNLLEEMNGSLVVIDNNESIASNLSNHLEGMDTESVIGLALLDELEEMNGISVVVDNCATNDFLASNGEWNSNSSLATGDVQSAAFTNDFYPQFCYRKQPEENIQQQKEHQVYQCDNDDDTDSVIGFAILEFLGLNLSPISGANPNIEWVDTKQEEQCEQVDWSTPLGDSWFIDTKYDDEDDDIDSIVGFAILEQLELQFSPLDGVRIIDQEEYEKKEVEIKNANFPIEDNLRVGTNQKMDDNDDTLSTRDFVVHSKLGSQSFSTSAVNPNIELEKSRKFEGDFEMDQSKETISKLENTVTTNMQVAVSIGDDFGPSTPKKAIDDAFVPSTPRKCSQSSNNQNLEVVDKVKPQKQKAVHFKTDVIETFYQSDEMNKSLSVSAKNVGSFEEDFTPQTPTKFSQCSNSPRARASHKLSLEKAAIKQEQGQSSFDSAKVDFNSLSDFICHEVTTNLEGVSVNELVSIICKRYNCNLQVAQMLVYSTISNDSRYDISDDIVSKIKSPIIPKLNDVTQPLHSQVKVNKASRMHRYEQEADISTSTQSIISYFEAVTFPRFQRCLDKLSVRTGLTPRTPRTPRIAHTPRTSLTPRSFRQHRQHCLKTMANQFE